MTEIKTNKIVNYSVINDLGYFVVQCKPYNYCKVVINNRRCENLRIVPNYEVKICLESKK